MNEYEWRAVIKFEDMNVTEFNTTNIVSIISSRSDIDVNKIEIASQMDNNG